MAKGNEWNERPDESCIKKYVTKSQMVTLNEHGPMSEMRHKAKWMPRQPDMCQTPKIKA